MLDLKMFGRSADARNSQPESLQLKTKLIYGRRFRSCRDWTSPHPTSTSGGFRGQPGGPASPPGGLGRGKAGLVQVGPSTGRRVGGGVECMERGGVCVGGGGGSAGAGG